MVLTIHKADLMLTIENHLPIMGPKIFPLAFAKEFANRKMFWCIEKKTLVFNDKIFSQHFNVTSFFI